MIELEKTDASSTDFVALVKKLDAELPYEMEMSIISIISLIK